MAHAPAGKKKPAFKKRLLFLFVFLCLLLGLLELSMILLEPVLFRGFYQYDPHIGFRVRPFARGTNRFGFPDREYNLEKDPRTFRILVVGDSYGWSGGIENNYTARVERKFEELYGGHRVDVINTSCPMTHTGEQLILLEEYGLQYRPDFVFLGFFAGNDFIDADPNRKRIVLYDAIMDIDKRQELRIFGYPIVPRSRLFEFLKHQYVVLREMIESAREGPEPAEAPLGVRRGSVLGGWSAGRPARGMDHRNDPAGFSLDTFFRIQKDRLEFCEMRRHERGEFDERIDHIFQCISEMQELLAEQEIGFMVGIFPEAFQVHEALLKVLLKRYELKREDYDVTLMQRLLKDFLASKGIPCIDLLDGFRARSSELKLYECRTCHWSFFGDLLAAELVFDALKGVVALPP